jgi:hypothetical protein
MQSELQGILSFVLLEAAPNPRQFAYFHFQTGPEKIFILKPQRPFGAVFSVGQIGSPVSSVARGEWNTITIR